MQVTAMNRKSKYEYYIHLSNSCVCSYSVYLYQAKVNLYNNNSVTKAKAFQCRF